MRILFGICLLCLTTGTMAQKAEIVKMETADRFFYGSIDDKYPITIYLKKVNTSDMVGWTTSYTGWYSYDKVGTPIPVSAVYDGNLHIFVSKDEKLLSSILDFEFSGEDGVERLDNYNISDAASRMKGLSERFEFSTDNGKVAGTWFSGDKLLSASLKGPNLYIGEEKNYLKLADGQYFDLANLKISGRTVAKIVSTANDGRNILISYAEHANLNYGGRCGGGRNAGYYALTFNENYVYMSHEHAEIEFCYRDIYPKNKNEISETVTEYEVRVPDEDVNITYLVDRGNATITVKK